MKRIALITTGGTIAMTKDPKTGGAVPALSANRNITEIDRLKEIAMIEHLEFSNLPSPHVSPAIMWKLSSLVNSLLKRDDIAGVVITHGTDTLEETAYFLDLSVNSDKPVICTAAMRSIDELGTDGPRNVVSSVRVATNPMSIDMGTMVCLNDEIHAAREVTKTYTSNVATFDSPGYGPLGIVDEDKIIFYRKPLQRETIEVSQIEEQVALYKTFTGDDGRILESLPKMGFKGIVLEAFGRGNVPPKVADVIENLVKANIPIIITSRCFKGRVLGVYGYKGGGLQLEKAGAIFAPGLSSQKARIKLMIIMGLTKDIENIREYFLHSKGGQQ
ncbi:asparaginase [Kosmotoga arenicorallina S304]|uniref:Asparaginase n=1 Tax=Kosmotoga arenicorallina S304 TaxID=1453497 RepID=A0A176K0D3_9BACT|nr:asparaginase [Kosmotoga arenicorallina]OAA30062.1 asparaginase [Kosmotoga arenicorallina S304]